MKKRIVMILTAALLVIALTACGGSANSPQPSVQTTVSVDDITQKARDAADSATDKDISAACDYIQANYADCFADQETMEQMMYCGWLLEYKYEVTPEKQDYHQLGQHAEQLAKYVYLGTDTADSDRTKASMDAVKQSLDALEQTASAAPSDAQTDASQDADSPPVSDKDANRTVYYTKTGKKYHYANPCGGGTYYPCTLAEAQSRGLEPCGKCVLH